MGEMGSGAIMATFRELLLRDQMEGRGQPLGHYQKLFPGHEAAIAAQYADLTGPSAADTASIGLGRIAHFSIERELGQGGQGVVFLAHDERLGRSVALKVLAESLFETPERRQRFEREASLAARLQHPAIATVFESGSDADRSYVAMQFIPGQTLRHSIEQAQATGEQPSRNTILQRVRAFADAVHAVHFAHEMGVVHRDLKPSNLMLSEDDKIVILDFGLARDLTDVKGDLTRSGELFGSPAYLPPEQIEGTSRGDESADVYSLGVALYEWCTLKRPFAGATREALFRSILRGEPVNACRVMPAVPRDLGVVLDVALSKDPTHRYDNARDFALDLQAIADRRAVAVAPPGPIERLIRWVRRDPRFAVATLGLIAALLTVAGFLGYLISSQSQLAEGAQVLEQKRIDQLVGAAFGYSETFFDFHSVAELQKAIEANPSLILARLHLAIQLQYLGQRQDSDELLSAAPADPDAAAAFEQVRRSNLPAELPELPARAGPLECYAVGGLLVQYNEMNPGNRAAVELAIDGLQRAILLAPRAELLFYVDYAEAIAQLTHHHRSRTERLGRQVADALVRLWPQSSMALGWAATVTPDPHEAADLHRACLEIDPGQGGCMIFLARHSVLVENDLDAGLEWYWKALVALPVMKAPEAWRDHYLFADALLKVQRRREALLPLRQAFELEPTEIQPYLTLAMILVDEGEVEEAWIVTDKALERFSDSAHDQDLDLLLDLQAKLEE